MSHKITLIHMYSCKLKALINPICVLLFAFYPGSHMLEHMQHCARCDAGLVDSIYGK